MALMVMHPQKLRMMLFVVRISNSLFSCHAMCFMEQKHIDSCVSTCLCTDLGQSLGVILLSNMYGFCIYDRLLSYMTGHKRMSRRSGIYCHDFSHSCCYIGCTVIKKFLCILCYQIIGNGRLRLRIGKDQCLKMSTYLNGKV